MLITKNRIRFLAGVAAITTFAAVDTSLVATAPQQLDIPQQKLSNELRAIARATGRDIMFASDAVGDRQGKPIHATMTADQAVDFLIENSDLVADHTKDGILIRGRSHAGTSSTSVQTSSEILVTGSRIRGAKIASPVLQLDQDQMINEGHTSLASALRDVPSNFGGGQNPGIGLGTTGSFDDSGASTINLRGLGGDATLTVLNGHRLPYNADFATIDISNIPFEAIERVEIVPDGSSALYGSDAVAGVANIILKKDYAGLTTAARISTTSDGGGEERQYSATGGDKWSSGGFIAAYVFERDRPIVGSDRSYGVGSPGLFFTPALKHNSALLSFHQDLASYLTFSIDGLYNHRTSRLDYSLDPSGNVLALGGSTRSRDNSFTIAPSLVAKPGSGWHVGLSGVYGEDRDHYSALNFYQGASIYPFQDRYLNRTEVVEATADGPIVDLGAGDIRVAIGGGYRRNTYREESSAISASQADYYGFGELNIPVISSAAHIPFVEALSLSTAARYERYPGIASVFSPKLGAILSPSGDFDLKASWGKSFKAPTFDQQFVETRVGIDPASAFGGSSFPQTATILELLGGNPSLRPERATSWSVTGSVHPSTVPTLKLDISYFNVAYRNRILQPITFTAQALSNPIYADLVNRQPSMQEIDEAVSSGAIQNVVGGPFNPDDVVAIVDNRYLNVASQHVHGIDGAIHYSVPLQGGQSVLLFGNASYLVSRQKLSDLQPSISLAGAIFQPPHFRAYGGASLAADPVTFTLTLSYTDGSTDVRATPHLSVGSMTTADATLRYKSSHSSGILSGWDISISVQNIANTKPPLIVDTQNYEQPYDAANFSPYGRVFSLRVAKTW